MCQVITGIYKNGVIKPVEPLAIPENSQVLITILPQQKRQSQAQKIQRLLLNAGLISDNVLESKVIEKRKRKRISISGKPLSELISGERI
jgi:predicted DNA-binding antitoxin AbrB/MazE fold protein